MSEENECPECEPGLPAWMGTFADLMSLLMCFFVLLLAFSEMDVLKYKQVAGSMRDAFGVQNKIEVKDIPKGTSIIAQEFSPGTPDPTPLNTVQQQTTDSTKRNLDVMCEGGDAQEPTEEPLSEAQIQAMMQEMVEQTQKDARNIANKLHDQIQKGQLEVETRGRKIIIRVKEKGSFDSGSDEIKKAFLPVMDKIYDVLLETQGKISISGHTDDLPIETERFRSNWDLSSARAASVAHELFRHGKLDEKRFSVSGFADVKPLAPNDSPKNRAKNRRVEIVIEQGGDLQADAIQVLKEEAKNQGGEPAEMNEMQNEEPEADGKEHKPPVVFDLGEKEIF